MKISIGTDHGGVEYKAEVKNYLQSLGHEVVDCGTMTTESCNYPEFAIAAARKVANHEVDCGIVICRSGEGVSIAANKVKGVRCGIAYNKTVARLMKEHNDANMISFGADYFSIEEVKEMLDAYLNAKFLGDKHEIRVKMISDYENK